MELALCLGDSPAKAFEGISSAGAGGGRKRLDLTLGFCTGLGVGIGRREEEEEDRPFESDEREGRRGSVDPSVQLSLLPFAHVQPELPWPVDKNRNLETPMRGFDVNEAPAPAEGGAAVSSLSIASDEEEVGGPKKKLRLSKEQSAFLEESFKEHNTLNPKQKLALAKQLNLRPRQVEVWFQNRRARTKLKQTEVDCEYLKRCCETLKVENRRLQKELSELRALKTSQPFFMQLPATTLSMCPSCDRVSSSSAAAAAAAASAGDTNAPAASNKWPVLPSVAGLFPGSRFYPFASPQPAAARQPSAAS